MNLLMRPVKVLSLTLIFVALIFPYSAKAEKSPYEVVVDFSREKKVSNLSGFLGTHDPELVPDNRLLPLKPGLVSVKTDGELERAKSLGAEAYTLLSSVWGYPGIAAEFNRKPPFKDIELWKETVRGVVKKFGTDVTYYIWNEPDMPIFWGLWPGASREKYYEVFHAAHDVIREELGDEAKIAGPTFSFLKSDFESFADYALANELRVDVLNFHLLYQKDKELPETMKSIDDLREKFLGEKGKYSAVGFSEIHVNEYLRADRQNSRPGSILNFIEKMENAGVEKASRACWGDPSIPCAGGSCMLTYFLAEWVSPGTCRDGSLTGLLDKQKMPRASWWVYKSYVQGVESRVEASSSSDQLSVLASRSGESENTAQIMLGHLKSMGKGNPINLKLNELESLPFMQENQTNLRVKAYLLPYKKFGAKAFENLPLIIEQDVVVEDGSALVSIPEVGGHEAVLVQLGFDQPDK